MWRAAQPEDSAAIIDLCAKLYAEDPGENRYTPAPIILATLSELLSNPPRGRAVVLEQDEVICGYALLITFWSNEYGGEVVVVDELYVLPAFRQRGYASQLFAILRTPDNPLWPNRPGAIFLEVSPTNTRAMAFYSKLGFKLQSNRQLILFPK